MTLCLVSIGSNLGDRSGAVAEAIGALRADPRLDHFAQSQLHETAPIGGPPGQEPYVNAVVRFDSQAPPRILLDCLQSHEHNGRRDRPERWSARTLDLDLLTYGQQIVAEPELRLPHPRMSFRPFVLAPAVEVAPDWVHPELGRSVEQLWRQLREGPDVIRVIGPNRYAIAAMIEVELAARRKKNGYNQFIHTDTGSHTAAASVKLCVDTDPQTAGCSRNPTLRLSDCPAAAWRAEVLAALACVWPKTAIP